MARNSKNVVKKPSETKSPTARISKKSSKKSTERVVAVPEEPVMVAKYILRSEKDEADYVRIGYENRSWLFDRICLASSFENLIPQNPRIVVPLSYKHDRVFVIYPGELEQTSREFRLVLLDNDQYEWLPTCGGGATLVEELPMMDENEHDDSSLDYFSLTAFKCG